MIGRITTEMTPGSILQYQGFKILFLPFPHGMEIYHLVNENPQSLLVCVWFIMLWNTGQSLLHGEDPMTGRRKQGKAETASNYCKMWWRQTIVTISRLWQFNQSWKRNSHLPQANLQHSQASQSETVRLPSLLLRLSTWLVSQYLVLTRYFLSAPHK